MSETHAALLAWIDAHLKSLRERAKHHYGFDGEIANWEAVRALAAHEDAEDSPRVTVVELRGEHPEIPVSAVCILTGCQHSQRVAPRVLSREAVEALPRFRPARGMVDAGMVLDSSGQWLDRDAVLRLFPADAPAQETTPWQPIETAPKDGTPILATAERWVTPRLMCWLDGPALGVPGWRLFDGDPRRGPYAPTHWMPLPAPPAVPSPAPGAGEQPT